jgi:hypothetical protein
LRLVDAWISAAEKLSRAPEVGAAWKNADAAEKSTRVMREVVEKSWSKPQH